MKYLFLLSLIYSCSQVPKKNISSDQELIGLESAFDHIRSSYLKGCVDAFKHLKVPFSFTHCRDEAILHEKEVREIVDSKI